MYILPECAHYRIRQRQVPDTDDPRLLQQCNHAGAQQDTVQLQWWPGWDTSRVGTAGHLRYAVAAWFEQYEILCKQAYVQAVWILCSEPLLAPIQLRSQCRDK